MDRIIDGVLRFQREVHPNDRALYRQLALAQSPEAMFIGCSDSRVVPENLTQQGPGSLFVVRNAGNIVPPSGPEAGGVSASIEYGVAVLGIPDIVICGHSGCGAMRAVVGGAAPLEELPAVARWLHYTEEAWNTVSRTHGQAGDDERLNALIHENVLLQLAHLLTHASVAKAVANKHLRLHGWVYDIGSGEVETYDAELGRFRPISENPFASGTPKSLP